MTSVVSLIQYMSGQAKKIFYLYCDRCEKQFKKELPLNFPITDVVCPNCKTDGFVIGHKKR